MFKILIDECLPNSLKKVFNKHGFESLHVRDAGLRGFSDDVIFKYAVDNEYILVTRDLDFSNILDYPLSAHWGIIVLKLHYEMTAMEINSFCDKFLNSVEPDQLEKALIIVDKNKFRIRK